MSTGKIKQLVSVFLENQEKIISYSAFWVPFLTYLFSLPPGVTWGDSPEFANAAISLGVTHPSGYPLFTVLGKLFSLLPFSEKAFGITLMSALFQSLAVYFVFRISKLLTENSIFSFLGALILTFSYTWWYHGRVIEVYALQNFLISVVFYLVLRYLQTGNLKLLFYICAFFGLSFTNHLTVILFIGSMLFILFSFQWKKAVTPVNLIKYFLIIAGFQITYLYIIWRAKTASGTTIMWNNPDDLASFWYHVSGKEYSVFRKTSAIFKGIEKFSNATMRQFGVIASSFALMGILEILVLNWRYGIFLIGVFFTYLIYNSSYSVMDIDSYYMVQYMIISISTSVGGYWLYSLRRESHKWVAFAIPVLMLFTAGALLKENHDLRYKDNLAHYFGHQAWDALPENSILISDVDGPAFTMWYQAYSLHPEDLSRVVITRAMYMDKNKKWYREFLRKKYPAVVWPDEGVAYGTKLFEKLISLNIDNWKFFAAVYFRIPFRDYSYVNQGWISALVRRNKPETGEIKSNKALRWSYMTKVVYANGREWYTTGQRSFHAGENIGCIAEYINKHKKVLIKWVVTDPDGVVYSKLTRAIPVGEPISALKFKIGESQIKSGDWNCSIFEDGALISRMKFRIN
ncbi:MAG: DUF2723 domain-containing protein [Deltaproteobacteria bacterium]|nr:DUF2723 domain-containing protein [Deltaproteobacteria bacterium]